MHELDAGGSITATYVTDDKGDPVSVTRFYKDANQQPLSKTYYYHYNVHGDVIAMTGEDGQKVAIFSYDAWGVPTEYDAAGAIVEIGAWTTATGGTPGDSLYFLFGGMLYDAMAGLYITRTRAYNPKTGRFLQRDILDEKGKDGVYAGFPFGKDAIGSNLYAWCGNNPASMEDPSGEWFNPRISARKVFYRASLRHSIRTNNPAAAAKALWNLAFGNGQQIVKYRTYPGFGPVPGIRVRVNQKSTFDVGAAISDAKSWLTSNIAQPIAQPIAQLIMNAQFRAMTGKEPSSTPYPASRYKDALDNSLNTASELGLHTAENWWNDPEKRDPSDPCVNATAGVASLIFPEAETVSAWNTYADYKNGHISTGDFIKGQGLTVVGAALKPVSAVLMVDNARDCAAE